MQWIVTPPVFPSALTWKPDLLLDHTVLLDYFTFENFRYDEEYLKKLFMEQWSLLNFAH